MSLSFRHVAQEREKKEGAVRNRSLRSETKQWTKVSGSNRHRDGQANNFAAWRGLAAGPIARTKVEDIGCFV